MKENNLQVVLKSPQFVNSHVKSEWLNLFSPIAKIEDPVGSIAYPYSKLPLFWDAFIAPNKITFHSKVDIVNEDLVARDVEIHTVLPSKHEIRVPAHLFYKIKDGKIISLEAHWDLFSMVLKFLKSPGSILAMLSLSKAIFKNLGFWGLWGFTKAFIFRLYCQERIVENVKFSKNANLNFSPNEFHNIKIINSRVAGFNISFTCLIDRKTAIGRFKMCPFTKKISWGRIYS